MRRSCHLFAAVALSAFAACSEGSDKPPGPGAGGGTASTSTSSGTSSSISSGGSSGGAAFADGHDRTVEGSGFGTKSTDAPFRYEDFEDGAEGAILEGWVLDDLGDRRPSYDRRQAFGGQQALFVDLGEGIAGNGARLSDLGFTEVYFSYRMYIVDEGGVPTDGPQIKFGRLTAGLGGDHVHGTPGIGATLSGTVASGSTIVYNGGSEWDGSFYGPAPAAEQWVRMELYLRLSDPADSPNGERYARLWHRRGWTYSGTPGPFSDPADTGFDVDGDKGAPLVTMTSGTDGDRLNHLLLPFYTRNEQRISIWVDEVYIDTTRARVEIGDAPHWADCTDRSPQPIRSWSDSQIEITLNRGQLAGTAYGFVVTTAGDIVELGEIGRWEP